jgi:ABC-type nitrate/sulfonate/bicarbonate transport system substrate-binding protein
MVDKGGFAAKRGLKVEILQIKAGATLMKALISGEIDSVDMGAAESIVAGVRGTGVKIVGCTWPGVPQVVLAKAEINTLADLKGKTVAISSPGSLPDLLFRGMLDAANVPFADVKLATQGADLDRYKSLVAGITDAAVVSNEFEALMPPTSKCSPRAEALCPNLSGYVWRRAARSWPSAGTISSNSLRRKWMLTNMRPRIVTKPSRWRTR